MNVRFSLGIDLGTSNSAVAVADLDSDQTRIVEITQVVGPNQLGETPTLASALYVPHCEEFPKGSFPLPWNDDAAIDAAVGALDLALWDAAAKIAHLPLYRFLPDRTAGPEVTSPTVSVYAGGGNPAKRFSAAEVNLLDLHGGVRRDRDILLFDPFIATGCPATCRLSRC